MVARRAGLLLSLSLLVSACAAAPAQPADQAGEVVADAGQPRLVETSTTAVVTTAAPSTTTPLPTTTTVVDKPNKLPPPPPPPPTATTSPAPPPPTTTTTEPQPAPPPTEPPPPPPTTTAPPTTTVPPPSTEPLAVITGTASAEAAQLANDERVAAGLAPLAISGQLEAAASAHSADQATHATMSHTGSDGSRAGDRITRAGFSWSTYGENVAYGYGSPSAVVAGWMNSDSHRDNILDPAFTSIGVAYATATDGTIYWTMDLAA